MAPLTEMRFSGWGVEAGAGELSEHVVEWLAQRFGGPIAARVAPPLEGEVRLSKSKLSKRAHSKLSERVGTTNVRTDQHSRLLHAAGKGYPDLLAMRSGKRVAAPDAVVYPADGADVSAVLKICAKHGIAVVPFGGGTSVVGGITPLRGGYDSVISLDLQRLRELISLDEKSRIGTFAAGLRGPELEHLLRARGYTLGHFPQSFEYATVGGWVATRSAGQASTGYGRIDEKLVGATLVAPAGELKLAARPASAAGPDLRALVAGSEGALGVITEASLEISPAPEVTRYEALMLPSFAAAADALRALEQAGQAPDVARASDEHETEMGLAFAGIDGAKGRLLEGYLRGRGAESGALVVLGWEGASGTIDQRRRGALSLLKQHGAVGLGAGAGRTWAKNRFSTPYLRDHLLERGVMVETLETSTTWSNLMLLYRGVGDALAAHAPIVGCHISHLYQSGASLYFTFVAPQELSDPHAQWQSAKREACDAIVAHGGTITHHHAIGIDHRRYLKAEDGPTGVAALRAVKASLDPSGLMNPGKLL
jgi:alkyldihydroxyacetonephosphate synthase